MCRKKRSKAAPQTEERDENGTDSEFPVIIYLILDKSCRMCRNIVPVAVCAEKRLHKRTKINGRVWDENSPVDAECWFLDVRSHAIIMLDKTVA